MARNENQIPKVLLVALVGSDGSAPDVVGGNRVMAEEAVRELMSRRFELDVLDTPRSATNLSPCPIYAARLARFLRVV